jgi:metal-dependent amidase/aminoacylase/carboxypeptidase family protein
MIAAGALDNVQCIFGGHLDNRYPSGHLIIHDGCVNASTDTVIITVAGKAGSPSFCHPI